MLRFIKKKNVQNRNAMIARAISRKVSLVELIATLKGLRHSTYNFNSTWIGLEGSLLQRYSELRGGD